MKKVKISVLLALFLTFGAAIFWSCSSSDEQQKSDNFNSANLKTHSGSYSISKKYFVVVDIQNNIVTELNEENELIYRDNEDVSIEEIDIIFTANNLSQNFENDNHFLEYIQSNPNETHGRIEVHINRDLSYMTEIEGGIQINTIVTSNSDCKDSNGSYQCNYRCIKQCAIDGIKAQNWFQMIECIAERFGCVVKWYAYCVIDHC